MFEAEDLANDLGDVVARSVGARELKGFDGQYDLVMLMHGSLRGIRGTSAVAGSRRQLCPGGRAREGNSFPALPGRPGDSPALQGRPGDSPGLLDRLSEAAVSLSGDRTPDDVSPISLPNRPTPSLFARPCSWGDEKAVVEDNANIPGAPEPNVKASPRRTMVMPEGRLGVGGLVNTRLATASCVVGVLDLAANEDEAWRSHHTQFPAILELTRRTDGTVASVSGMRVLITWGLLEHTPAQLHTMQAFLFAERLRSNQASNTPMPCGISTGAVTACNIGDERARFISHAGGCLRVASTLCDVARALQTTALFSGSEFPRGSSLRRRLRPVLRLRLDNGGLVYEVGRNDSGSEAWGWSAEYEALFEDGAVGPIAAKAAEIRDRVLLNACQYPRGACPACVHVPHFYNN